LSDEFIGRGWAFPIETDATGAIALVERARELEVSMRLILGTAYGERPMRPEFGCAIHEYVFASVNATTAGRIAYEVKMSLTRWEPRVEVIEVVVTYETEQPGTMYIDIRYVERETNDPRNLVFPFYVIPTEGSSEGSAPANGAAPLEPAPVRR
jgi:phage baseplate assembly protein W